MFFVDILSHRMSEIGMFQQLRIAICRKHITARPKKLPLCGPVGDDKDDLGECSTILVFQKPVLVHGYRCKSWSRGPGQGTGSKWMSG